MFIGSLLFRPLNPVSALIASPATNLASKSFLSKEGYVVSYDRDKTDGIRLTQPLTELFYEYKDNQMPLSFNTNYTNHVMAERPPKVIVEQSVAEDDIC
jgi:hypothetical protein